MNIVCIFGRRRKEGGWWKDRLGWLLMSHGVRMACAWFCFAALTVLCLHGFVTHTHGTHARTACSEKLHAAAPVLHTHTPAYYHHPYLLTLLYLPTLPLQYLFCFILFTVLLCFSSLASPSNKSVTLSRVFLQVYSRASPSQPHMGQTPQFCHNSSALLSGFGRLVPLPPSSTGQDSYFLSLFYYCAGMCRFARRGRCFERKRKGKEKEKKRRQGEDKKEEHSMWRLGVCV